MAVAEPPQGNLVGQLLGWRYHIVQELGQGGFGRTYLAHDAHRFHELCVLKEFAPQVQGTQALQKAEELFAREAGVLYKLQHPQIPRFRELFRADLQEGRGRLFLVQDFVEGQTYEEILRTRQQQGYGFTEPEVLELLFQLLPVLEYIHASGVVHRDISPDNLIRRSADGLPVLIDFGGVKQAAATVAGQIDPQMPSPSVTRLGKAGYAPDEQLASGEAFPHSDLYALAVTVLVLLTGKEPQAVLGNDRRQWQRHVHLNPTLSKVLDRLLEPLPANRYQSAQAVLQTLKTQALRANPIPSPVQVQSATAATMAVSPAAAPNLPPQRPPTKRRSSGVGKLLALLLLALSAGTGWWLGSRWLTLPTPQRNPAQSNRPSGNPIETTEVSQAEQARKQAIANRRQELGVDSRFLVQLVDDAFYAKHPIGRALSEKPEDERLRADWDAIANQALDRLKSLSSEARASLGNYTATDLEKRRAMVNQLNLSGRSLNDLTDAQFFHLFPEHTQTQNLLEKPIGQVWQAIAADQAKALQAGQILERIKFPPGQFSQRVNGTLQPGKGRVYTARLSKGQSIRLMLQAPNQATQLSIYPPLSKLPALLEDSPDLEWSGRLEKTGLYEIVVVSTASELVSYELDLAAADEVTSGE